MPVLIRGGTVVNADGERRADVLVDGEVIVRVEAQLDARALPPDTRVIDATGTLVFPGFIDPHVHVHLPFMGTHAADDHDSASRAALAGGTTTIIEMICPGPKDEPLASFEAWHGRASAKSRCDFAFHQAVVRWDDLARSQLKELVATQGQASFKVFLAYKGALDLPDAHLLELLEFSAREGVIVTAHCENADAVAYMQARLLAEGKIGPEWHEPSRPVWVEADGVQHFATCCQLTGAHGYVVHTSCRAALEQAAIARARGVNLSVECVVPHLVLDDSCTHRPNFEGATYVMSPPLRTKDDQQALWLALAKGDVATIGTDHAPFHFATQKVMGRDRFTAIPNGIGSIQERIDLVHTYGVRAGHLTRTAMVDACSTQVAKVFGLFPKKGIIAPGSDADIVVYDPERRGVFRHADGQGALDNCAYEGMERIGATETVLRRGEVVVEHGRTIAPAGGGRYLRREPRHFGR
ncbi:MAG: dihydropyrimidinase [Planctomycetota bacterium]|nr:dihydropyrimidinase [Planctomycetota bacterium]MDA1106463.1 dihydropyrimidinase [Planctomycetota bacterium]